MRRSSCLAMPTVTPAAVAFTRSLPHMQHHPRGLLVLLLALVCFANGSVSLDDAERTRKTKASGGDVTHPCWLEREDLCFNVKTNDPLMPCLVKEFKEEPHAFTRKCFDWVRVVVMSCAALHCVCV